MYKILVVEDDETIVQIVKRHLQSWGYEVFQVEDFAHVIREFVQKDPQLVLLDLKLPFYNGFHWCEEIRKISQVPVLFLSSAADNMNMVMAMSRGADDFIAKPFDLDVLAAKVQAVLRRTYAFGQNSSLLEHNGVVLNPGNGTISANGQQADLTKNELKILQILFEHQGRVVSRDAIMTKLWESDSFVDDNTLTVNITRIRRKLESLGIRDFIVTKKGLGYIAVLVIICETGFLIWGYRKYRKKQQNLLYIKENGALALEHMEAPEDENEALYQDICRLLDEERIKARNKSSAFGTELMDFYTMWVHQIKTPIAASRLLLQEGELNPGEIQNELFKIEQYVDMVLGYLRTQDLSSDLCLEEVNLDEIIKDQIHKFARIFVGKKLSLDYEGVEETVLTDKKWLGFVVGQIISNALKYTKKGKISIYMSKARSHTLVIEDTGIGIRQEDLPRVFEKGFTGYNGREEGRSTGIGLYLCGKIMKKLDHGIRIESEQGKGTRVFLELGRKKMDLY